MFEWYARSDICYAYLEDCVDCPLRTRKDNSLLRSRTARTLEQEKTISRLNTCMIAQLRFCKWLTRGWTLQELIAPKSMTFIDKNWVPLFERSEIQHTLHDVTGIARGLFDREETFLSPYQDNVRELYKRLWRFPVVEKMSWASSRRTTRSEDIAYRLLGIFGVNMHLLYGEGERAFSRLQDAIMKVNVDQTILAWECRVPSWKHAMIYKDMLLAPHPSHFNWWRSLKRDVMKTSPSTNEPSIKGSMEFPESFQLTNSGLHISLRCLDASTVRRITVRIFNRGPKESSKPSMGQALETDDRNEHSVGEKNKNYSRKNMDLKRKSKTGRNSGSASASHAYATTNSGPNEARQSHEDSVSCALLDCVLKLGGKTYVIAIQFQDVQKGDRYKASVAVDNLVRHSDRPHHLLLMQAEAVGDVKRQAILIRHDHTVWYF